VSLRDQWRVDLAHGTGEKSINFEVGQLESRSLTFLLVIANVELNNAFLNIPRCCDVGSRLGDDVHTSHVYPRQAKIP